MHLPARAALAAAALGSLALMPGAPTLPLPLPAASASVPTTTPVFSTPLVIDNEWFPVEPGEFKVYAGRDGSDRVTVVEHFLTETRDFDWNATTVSCRIVEETVFEDGRPVERSRGHFAQADDGTVWYFGETFRDFPPGPGDDPEDDPNDTESSGWVVGALAPEDPPETVAGAQPTIFMPANPEASDTWKPEDIPAVVDETFRVVRTGVGRRVPAGRFADCIEIRASDGIDGVHDTKWFAPGVGLVMESSRRERLALQAGTLVRRR